LWSADRQIFPGNLNSLGYNVHPEETHMPVPSDAPPWRKAVVQEAEKWVGKVGGIRKIVQPGKMDEYELNGYQTLIEIYKKAGETENTIIRTWTPEVERGIKQGYWARKQPRPKAGGGLDLFTSVDAEGIAWCGIFAAWVLKRVGFKVYWGSDRKLHSNGGDLTLGYPANGASSGWRDQIQAGDICVLGSNQHHVIIVSAKPGAEQVETIEGNIPAPERHSIVSSTKSKSQFHTWYQLSDL
jgi:hypothetical protein